MQPELNLDLSKTYIFEGREYMLTGRIAERSPDYIPRPTRRSKRRATETEETTEQDLMVEIRPMTGGSSVIGSSSEKMWVKYNDLYAVVDVLSEDDD